jgi:hypothetical protein
MAASLREVMSGISLDDMVVAPDGRVVIANPEVAARINAIKVAPTDPQPAPEPTNGRRCRPTTNNRCGPNLNCGPAIPSMGPFP